MKKPDNTKPAVVYTQADDLGTISQVLRALEICDLGKNPEILAKYHKLLCEYKADPRTMAERKVVDLIIKDYGISQKSMIKEAYLLLPLRQRK